MGSLSNFAEQACINHLSTNQAYSPAANLYLALATGDPGETATGASMSEAANANGYARTAITFGAAASRRITQNADVVFPQASGSWGTISHWAIVDSGTHGAGNVLAYGAFGTPFTLVSGNVRTVPSGQVYVEFSAGGITDYAANGFLDRMFRNQAFTVSGNFASLHTGTNSDATPGTEVSGTSYARKEINEAGGASPSWTTASGGAVSNEEAVSFGAPGGSWGTVVSMGIYDALTNGNQLAYDNGIVDQAIGTESTDVTFPIGDLDFAIT
jgi:hypothetical protein